MHKIYTNKSTYYRLIEDSVSTLQQKDIRHRWRQMVQYLHWRWLHRAGGTCSSICINGGTRRGTVSTRTANNNWPHCTDHHESDHQND